jgi:hypothetical protein
MSPLFKLISGEQQREKSAIANKNLQEASPRCMCAAGGRSTGAFRDGRVFSFLVGQWHGNDGRYLARDQSSVSFARLLTLRGGGGR